MVSTFSIGLTVSTISIDSLERMLPSINMNITLVRLDVYLRIPVYFNVGILLIFTTPSVNAMTLGYFINST